MAIDVQEPESVHERGPGLKFSRHHGACLLSRLIVGFDLNVRPLVQVLRDVLQEQRDARRRIPQRIAHLLDFIDEEIRLRHPHSLARQGEHPRLLGSASMMSAYTTV
ncbi:hypothetical protein ACIP98_40220 [Streptomyces sp. NPDC088354]|uniref:hypothetical protein n=1 Tax=Streptomyces sp. NPDC088354 TaxID=3365856 RepID=UPI003805A91C